MNQMNQIDSSNIFNIFQRTQLSFRNTLPFNAKGQDGGRSDHAETSETHVLPSLVHSGQGWSSTFLRTKQQTKSVHPIARPRGNITQPNFTLGQFAVGSLPFPATNSEKKVKSLAQPTWIQIHTSTLIFVAGCLYFMSFPTVRSKTSSKTRQKELYFIVFHSISSFWSQAVHQVEESSGPAAVRAPSLPCSHRKGWCKSSPQRLPNLKENRNTLDNFDVNYCEVDAMCEHLSCKGFGFLGLWLEYLTWTSTHVSSAPLFSPCVATLTAHRKAVDWQRSQVPK